MKSLFKSFVVKVLTAEARLALRLHDPKIVAVTGNVGKTSTKDAIYTVLRGYYPVRKSEKSFNSEIGVPLAILGLPNAWSNPFGWLWNFIRGLVRAASPGFPKVLVLEIGADRPGDISSITRWLSPDVVVYTRMQTVPVHVENFGSPERMFQEKGYLGQALKHHGIVVLNGDDEKMKPFTKGARDIWTFGFKNGSDVRGDDYYISYDQATDLPYGIVFKAHSNLGTATYSLPGVIGKHYAYPMLAAITVGEVFDITPEEAAKALSGHKTPHGRMRLVKGEKCLIIDDSYNSSPIALEEGLNALADLEISGKKIAVLGDMKELGRYSKSEHKRLGVHASKIAHTLVAVGEQAVHFAEGARESGMPADSILTFKTSEEAIPAILARVREGDAVLVKGSQSMRMEHIARALLPKHVDPGEHLVRQEKEWKGR